MSPNPTIAHRSAMLLAEHAEGLHRRTDRLFAGLLAFQFVVVIEVARWISPGTWLAGQGQIWTAFLLGGVFSGVPIVLALRRPGRVSTRHSIAAGQASISALLIHLCGGRAETHFLIFGSLAFLACYRDWRVLLTATTLMAADHVVRGLAWPQSLLGTVGNGQGQAIEHVVWLGLTSIFLMRLILSDQRQLQLATDREARIEIDLQAAAGAHTVAHAARGQLQERLTRAHKLEAVGQLTAGIAHEIDTPTQYVSDNTQFVQTSFQDLAPLLEKAGELARAVRDGSPAKERADELIAAFETADMEYLVREIPRAIGVSLEGIDQVAKIILAVREFSHLDDDELVPLDLNHAIESTITVATGEWKYVAELETDFEPGLPRVTFRHGELSQVILDLIVNAARAISRAEGQDAGGRITISTRRDGEFAEIRVSDTGGGIPEAAHATIFEPGSNPTGAYDAPGPELAEAYALIVGGQQGTLDFETRVGYGTTFVLRLPFEPHQADSKTTAA